MIAYFPDFYPDELLYSLLSRYYTKSGYLAYTYVAEELFVSKTVRPDIEFVNTYTPSALKMITKDMPMEDVVLHHTMFPLLWEISTVGAETERFSRLGVHAG